MKITKKQLKRIIKEELGKVLVEQGEPFGQIALGWWVGMGIGAIINAYMADGFLREGAVEIKFPDGSVERVGIMKGETIRSPGVKERVVEMLNTAVREGRLSKPDIATLTDPLGGGVDPGRARDLARSLELARKYGKK
jgi:hypothetical protein